MDKVERFIEGMDFEQFLADDRMSFELFELLKSSVKLQSTSPRQSGAGIRGLHGQRWLECGISLFTDTSG